MTMTAQEQMPVRIMDFEFNLETVRNAVPAFFPALGLSMTLPFLEPYLIRTMKSALEKTSDELVADEVKQFIGQEAQHFRQHKKLNDLIKESYPGFTGLEKIEQQMESDYQHFTRNKSLKFNLAYAEGFEAATCAVARNEIRFQEFNKVEEIQGSDVYRLFAWHLTEEVEHRTVTFNIYKHLYGDYFYRLIIGIYGQYHFFKYVFRFARVMEKNLPKELNSSKPKPPSFKVVATLLASLLKTYLPNYDPAQVKLPDDFALWSQRYLDEAKAVRSMD